jgi:hypothetical protein
LRHGTTVLGGKGPLRPQVARQRQHPVALRHGTTVLRGKGPLRQQARGSGSTRQHCAAA